MLARSRHLILLTALVATGLTACDNQNAADHRAQTEIVRSATVALQAVPAAGPKATSQLKAITRDLRGIRGNSKTLEGTAQRLIGEAESRLGILAWQAGATERTNATEAAARIAGYLASATRRQEHVGQYGELLDSLSTNQLEALQSLATQQHTIAQQQHDNQIPALEELDKANVAAAKQVLNLRMRAGDLRAKANAVDGVTGKKLRIESATVEHQAAVIEAEMERRGANADLNHRLTVDQLAMRADGAAEHVVVVNGEITRIQELSVATRARSEDGRLQLDQLSSRLSTEGNRLIDLLTGPTQDTFTATVNHYQQAVLATNKAIRLGSRGDKKTDQLSAVQAEMAILSVSVERQSRLRLALRILGDVSAMGEVQGIASRWSETRQLLQDRLDEATTMVEQSRSKAAGLAGGLGDGVGDALLNMLEPPSPEGDDSNDSAA
jgi:hypothetical protein